MAGGDSEPQKDFFGFQRCLCCRWEQEGSSWIINKPSFGTVGVGNDLCLWEIISKGVLGAVELGKEAEAGQRKCGQEVFVSPAVAAPGLLHQS